MQWFALVPADVVTRFYVWQLVTYLFLHGGFFHILFNMLALWFFGKDLEDIWGTRRFLQFYFFCGVGAGIVRGAGQLPVWRPTDSDHWRVGGDLRGPAGGGGAVAGQDHHFLYFPDQAQVFCDDYGARSPSLACGT